MQNKALYHLDNRESREKLLWYRAQKVTATRAKVKYKNGVPTVSCSRLPTRKTMKKGISKKKGMKHCLIGKLRNWKEVAYFNTLESSAFS